MIVDEKRNLRQDGIVDNLAKAGGIGALKGYPGFGKTITGLKAHIRIKNKIPLAETHVVVPTQYLQDQWNEKIKERNLEDVEVFVINSYIKQKRSCTFLILDEILSISI